MKYTTPTLLAILASASFVSAAPSEIDFSSTTTGLVKKDDVSDALSLIEEIGRLNQKRSLVEDEGELSEISKRADNLLSELLSALSNSGIIGDVWNIITKDQGLKSELGSLIKSAVKGAIAQGPALIKAVWQSGLLQTIFKDIWNDQGLRSSLFNVAKAIFSSGLNLLKTFLANKEKGSGGNNNQQQKRDLDEVNFNPDVYYDKRDLADVAETVVNAIKNSGIVQNLVKKALADPQKSVNFLKSALHNGVVAVKDVYNWSKNNGVLDDALNFIKEHGPTFAKDVAGFIGGKISSGEASVSDVDNASGNIGTKTATATATTTAAAAAGSPAATTLVRRRLY